MINPINQSIEVGYGGKLYPCDISLGQLALVEGEVGVNIVYPAGVMLWNKPEAYQRGVILYALLQPHGISLLQCMAAVTGADREYFAKKVTRAIERLQPVLHELWGVSPKVEQSRPLDVTNGGPNSGQVPESILTSETPNSGA